MRASRIASLWPTLLPMYTSLTTLHPVVGSSMEMSTFTRFSDYISIFLKGMNLAPHRWKSSSPYNRFSQSSFQKQTDTFSVCSSFMSSTTDLGSLFLDFHCSLITSVLVLPFDLWRLYRSRSHLQWAQAAVQGWANFFSSPILHQSRQRLSGVWHPYVCKHWLTHSQLLSSADWDSIVSWPCHLLSNSVSAGAAWQGHEAGKKSLIICICMQIEDCKKMRSRHFWSCKPSKDRVPTRWPHCRPSGRSRAVAQWVHVSGLYGHW